ncbi:hypothetical protein [Actinacidiphila acididurans]|uniref:Uncharacterized protein n=1 Tax=Actinacidiphila acididurans TaxID=2784346 RepID=A0ABS2TYK0_9ACTN|nr:hypothetical protein [Actinacidiphila acididurans]MBM9508413.1 hypothetical protein [Actinacidiphila acididurans]
MSEQSATQSLTDVYVDRIRADLARVDAEIAETHARLDRLAKDRGWLADLLDRLPDTRRGAGPAASQADLAAIRTGELPAATVPEADGSGAAARTPKAAAPAPAEAPRRAAVPGRRRRSGGGPTLVELVVRYLEGRSEPTSVLDVTEMLNNYDEDRTVSTVVVRNTLESLVAKGVAERSKEGRSVHYALRPAAA